MSYDIRISVKVEGCDKYAQIATPEYDSPTYNLGDMFRACMDWDYSMNEMDENGVYQTCYYPCGFVIDRVEHGLKELKNNRYAYREYNSSNGCWVSINSAIEALESLRKCIYEQAEDIPINCLYMSWG